MFKKMFPTIVGLAALVLVGYFLSKQSDKKPIQNVADKTTEAVKIAPPSSEQAITATSDASTSAPVLTVARPAFPTHIMAQLSPGAVPSGSAILSAQGSPSSFSAERGLEALLIIGHLVPVSNDDRSFSEGLLEAGYNFGTFKVSVGQQMKKLYEVAEYAGENEFLLEDTQIFVDHTLYGGPRNFEIKMNTGATLPVSKASREMKRITRPWLTVELNKRITDTLTVSVSPTIQYYFNQWATSPAGNPLRRMVLGAGANLRWMISTDKVALNAWGKGYYQLYEEYDLSSVTPAPTTDFAIGTNLEFQLMKNLSLQAGVVRGSTMLSGVQYETNFYDPIATRYYAAIQLKL